MAYVLLLCWLDPALPWPLTLSTPRIWGLAALNLLPVLILNAAFLVITRRLLLSNWLTVLALGAVYFVNHLKMQELATPLLPDDFRFLKTLGVSYSFFAQYLASSRMQLCFAILTLSVTLLLVRREPTIEFLKGRSRGAIALAAVVLAISLAHGSAPWKVIYNAGNLEFEPWAPRDSAARTGIITNMLLFYWELADDSPDSVNLEQARRVLHDRSLLAPLPVAAVERTELPDIIIFQSESLFDPSRLAGVDYDALPRLRAAMSRGWSGNLHVPTFGGGTIRTEFEVLTGLPLAAFARVRYPYLQLRRSEIPGLVRELKARDYRTLALHPNGGAFWNRNDAFRAMGFDRFINGPAFDGAERHGHYVSDAALVERVMAEMDDDGAPQMIMAISIQNHGPYDDVPLASNERPEIQIAGLDATTQSALQTYMAMVQATDQQLARLIDFVESRQRRTLLLVYSDHMPPLNRVFAQVPFQNGRRPEEQAVPWLLLDNGSDEVRTDDHPSWFLPAVVLERAGIRDVAYFNLLQEIRRQEVWNCSCDAPSETTTALAHLRYFDQIESAMASDELL
ncbi:LTA synthase family protein [Steroidobacter sp. S1-65]|uniref:LTA synthase family protein n=1 Tax=Steroidobacter gossypii TaxID=2805490 RepID=A0ABS1WW58_9GAMM|nr:LTA synthase family protein [Steroidobacter gossypii]